MTRSRTLAAYGLVLAAFLALDAVWLTSTADRLYRPAIGHLMGAQPSLAPAAFFYLLYAAGIVGFAVAPALAAGRAAVALGRGAALGLLAYGAYDFTNQATLRDWPWGLTVADLAWGTAATGAAAWAAAAVLLRRGRAR